MKLQTNRIFFQVRHAAAADTIAIRTETIQQQGGMKTSYSRRTTRTRTTNDSYFLNHNNKYNHIQKRRFSFHHVEDTRKRGFDITNDLEQSLVDATNDPRKITKFYRDLLRSDVFFLPDTFYERTSPGMLGLILWVKNDEHWLPVWTSMTALHQTRNADEIAPYIRFDADAIWSLKNIQGYMDDPNMVMFPPMPASHRQTYLWMKARRLFECEFEESVVLNPGLDYGKEFTRKEIDDILDKMSDIDESYNIEKADGTTIANRIRKAVADKKKK
jgi:hypothetical protein